MKKKKHTHAKKKKKKLHSFNHVKHKAKASTLFAWAQYRKSDNYELQNNINLYDKTEKEQYRVQFCEFSSSKICHSVSNIETEWQEYQTVCWKLIVIFYVASNIYYVEFSLLSHNRCSKYFSFIVVFIKMFSLTEISISIRVFRTIRLRLSLYQKHSSLSLSLFNSK